MEQTENLFAPEAATDEPASPFPPAPGSAPAFEPAPLRYRRDGLTPAKQREYVEALADTGVARAASARIGITEQAINRVRRRADARGFDLACEAAQRFGARRIQAVAFERAIEGTVKRHYYHGELKSEERVYDNRLLVYLLGRTAHLLAPPAGAGKVADDWEAWMDALERGLPRPPAPDAPEARHGEDAAAEAPGDEDEEEELVFDGDEVWKDEDDVWWTRFPPTADFFGHEEGVPGDDYKRTLSAAELEVVEEEAQEDRAAELARERARRDAWFGFRGARFPDEEDDEAEEGDEEEGEDEEDGEPASGADAAGDPGAPSGAGAAAAEAAIFFPREAETYGTSAAPAPAAEDGAAATQGKDGEDDPPSGPRITGL